jgi:hypothetical protein
MKSAPGAPARTPRAGRIPLVAAALLGPLVALAPLVAQPPGHPLEEPAGPPAPRSELPTATSPGRILVHGAFTLVQVNVDANGNNIVGDAANEPSIAVSRLDHRKIAVGWRQFDSISSNFRQAGVNVSLDGGRTWQAATVLGPGIFGSDPVLGAAADGTMLYSSLHTVTGFDFDTSMYRSLDDLASWEPDVYSYGGDKQWIAVDTRQGQGRGHVYQAWDTYTCAQCGSNLFDRSVDEGATWQPPVPLAGGPYWGTLAIAPDGGLWVAGTPDGGSSFGAAYSSNAHDPGATPTFSYHSFGMGGTLVYGGAVNPGGLGGQVWIGIDRSGGPRNGWIYVVCSVDPPGSDPSDVMFVRSTDGGNTWSTPVAVNDNPNDGTWQWFGTMSVAPNGRIDVIWNDTRDDPGTVLSRPYYRYSNDGGTTWSAEVQLADSSFNPLLGWPQQNKIGDYSGMVSDRVGADAIFAATYNNEQDVYYVRIGDRDCNDNGVGDAEDITNGFDTDLDADGIPDHCESDADGDGAVDAIDNCPMTANRDQIDSDGDGVGDACEPLFADGFESGDTSAWTVAVP